MQGTADNSRSVISSFSDLYYPAVIRKVDSGTGIGGAAGGGGGVRQRDFEGAAAGSGTCTRSREELDRRSSITRGNAVSAS